VRLDAKAERDAARYERLASEHPCHACPERAAHERWAARASQLENQVRGIERRIRGRTETLARQFERVLGVLEDLGHLRGGAILPKGLMLARIYGEGDVLVTEMLDGGLLDGLSAAEATALVSTLVYESRDRIQRRAEMPTAETEARYRRLAALYRRIRRSEDEHHVELCRELDAAFATPAFHWAEGLPLEDVLAETGMAPGDFVRACKQLIDLLRQIEEVAADEEAGLVRAARVAVDRGVVAYTGV
jgi:ATP-dependent RNA helicase HelY